MKYIFTIFAFVFTIFSYSQNKYSSGFEKGFKDGYCYEQQSGCIAPITPITPIPKIGESSDSYDDGYKRGFQVGLDQSRNDKSTTSEKPTRERYQTSDPKFIDFTYKPSYELMMKALEAKEKAYEAYVMSAPQREENFKKNLQLASDSFNNQNYQNAVNYSKSALSNGFHNDYVYYLLGASYYNLGDYDNAITNLEKSKSLGNYEASRYIDLIKEREKTMEYIKPFQFGVKGGFNINNVKSSFVLGVFLQGNRNIFGIKNFSGSAEILFFQSGYTYTTTGVNSEFETVSKKYEVKDNILQVNLILKNKLVDKFDITYGPGISAGLDKQSVFFDLNGGVQYHIMYNLFAEFRLNKSIATISEGYNANIDMLSLNTMLTVGYKF